MDYKVIWNDEAVQESGQIVSYINQFNPMAERKTVESIFVKFEK